MRGAREGAPTNSRRSGGIMRGLVFPMQEFIEARLWKSLEMTKIVAFVGFGAYKIIYLVKI